LYVITTQPDILEEDELELDQIERGIAVKLGNGDHETFSDSIEGEYEHRRTQKRLGWLRVRVFIFLLVWRPVSYFPRSQRLLALFLQKCRGRQVDVVENAGQ